MQTHGNPSFRHVYVHHDPVAHWRWSKALGRTDDPLHPEADAMEERAVNEIEHEDRIPVSDAHEREHWEAHPEHAHHVDVGVSDVCMRCVLPAQPVARRWGAASGGETCFFELEFEGSGLRGVGDGCGHSAAIGSDVRGQREDVIGPAPYLNTTVLAREDKEAMRELTSRADDVIL